MKKLLSFILCTCILLSVFSCAALAFDDVDIDFSESAVPVSNQAVFVNTAGQVVKDENAYSEVIVDGEQTEGSSMTASCKFDEASGCYTFKGWYDGNTLVSSKKTFSFEVGQYNTLVPYITSTNVLTDASSFETLTTNKEQLLVPVSNLDNTYKYSEKNDSYSPVSTAGAPTGQKWGMFSNFTYATHTRDGDNYIPITAPNTKGGYGTENYFHVFACNGPYNLTYYTSYNSADVSASPTATVEVTPHSGNSMVATNMYFRSLIRELKGLKANTDYVLSVWVYAQSELSYTGWGAVASSYKGLQTTGTSGYDNDCQVLGVVSNIPQNYGTWNQVKIPFNSGNNTTAYLHLGMLGSVTGGDYGLNFMDDLTVYELGSTAMEVGNLYNEQKVTTEGTVRVTASNELSLEYTGSAMSFTASCEGAVKMDIKIENANSWTMKLKLFVDGVAQDDILLNQIGNNTVVLATGLLKGMHTFKLVRATEYNIGRIYLKTLTLNGTLSTPPAKPDKIYEFYGDSITAGYGTETYTDGTDWPLYEDGTKAYAYLTAQNMGAEAFIHAYSGIGLTVGGGAQGNGNTFADMYAVFTKHADADVVVINLGTNDEGKHALLNLTDQQVKAKYLEFAQTVRADHPNADIIFAYGMMTDRANSYALDTVAAMQATDSKVFSIQLPRGISGGGGHPNAAQQKAAADILTAFIKGLHSTLAGDINDDKAVNLVDVTCLAQSVAGWDVAVNASVADVNGDSETGLTDVVALAQYVAGWSNIEMTGDLYSKYNSESMSMNEIQAKTKLNGRTTYTTDGLHLEWGYSGFTVTGQFSGEISIEATVTTELLGYAILDDDYDNPVQFRINNGKTVMLSNITPGRHTVQFVKASGVEIGYMTVTGLNYNGSIFKKPADKALKIEVVGDSISSGAGLYKTAEQPDRVLNQNCFLSYSTTLARKLDADCSLISIAGISCCAKTPNMTDYYNRTLHSDSTTQWAFDAADEPDLIVIALGTNDTPSFVERDDQAGLKAGIQALVRQVRAKNPNAPIVWVYGMMATNWESVYRGAITELAQTDSKLYYKFVNRNNCDGDSGHPTPEGHIKNANELLPFVSELLK